MLLVGLLVLLGLVLARFPIRLSGFLLLALLVLVVPSHPSPGPVMRFG